MLKWRHIIASNLLVLFVLSIPFAIEVVASEPTPTKTWTRPAMARSWFNLYTDQAFDGVTEALGALRAMPPEECAKANPYEIVELFVAKHVKAEIQRERKEIEMLKRQVEQLQQQAPRFKVEAPNKALGKW